MNGANSFRRGATALVLAAAGMLPAVAGAAGSPQTTFIGVHVVDVRRGMIVRDQTVIVSDGRIVRVGPAGELQMPAAAQVVDARGRYLVPGLMDMHAHVSSEEDLALYLANGVTTIRSMWGHPSTLELRAAVAAGRVPGPTLFVAGQIIDGQPAIQFPTLPLADPSLADSIVAGQAEAGYDLVKIYSNMSRPVFDAVAAAGRRHGIEVAGHLPQAVPARHAISAGMGTMEHFLEVVGSVVSPPAVPSLDLAVVFRNVGELVTQIGERKVDLVAEVDDARLAEVARAFASSETRVVPTLVAMRNFTTAPNGAIDDWHRYVSLAQRSSWENGWKQRAQNWPASLRRGEDAVYRLRLHVLAALHRAGAKILVGTDAPVPGVYQGFSVIDEILALKQIGMTNAEALRAATLAPGEYVRRMPRGRDVVRGEITAGAAADLLLLERNPLEDLAALRSSVGVMQAGRWYGAADLRSRLEQAAARYAEWESRFADAPDFGAPSPGDGPRSDRGQAAAGYGDARRSTLARGRGVADFVGPGSRAARVSVRDSAQGRVVRAAIRDDAGRWRRWEARETGDGWLFEGDGDSPVRVRREGAGWVLGSSSAVQATAGAAPAAVVLTGTPADILLLDAVASGLGPGQARAFVAWRCSSPLSCDGASATSGEIVGRGFEIIGTGSMIAGTLGYEVRRVEVPGADGRTAILQRYWVGDGPLYSGEAFRTEGAGIGDWMRVR